LTKRGLPDTGSNGYLSIKNWRTFQHYGKRRPPWVKLYTSILDDEGFEALPDASKLLFLLLFPLAGRLENRIPNDPKYLRRKLPMTGKVDTGPLIAAGFLIVEAATVTIPTEPTPINASTLLASDRDREETEKRQSTDTPPPASAPADGGWRSRTPEQEARVAAVWKRIERKYPGTFAQTRTVFYSHMAKENPFFDVAINALISLADHQADNPPGYLKHILKIEEPNACEQRAIHESNLHKKERPIPLGEILERKAE
jgi:hypothetical protein